MNKAMKSICLVAAGLIVVGLAMAGFGFVLGGDLGVFNLGGHLWNESGFSHSWNDANRTLCEEETAAFHSIEVDVQYQEIELCPGDRFSVKYGYNEKYGKVSHRMEGDALLVTETIHEQGHWGWNQEREKNLGGKLVITYPRGTEFKIVELSGDLAEIEVDGVTAETLSVRADLGSISVIGSTAQDMKLSAAAGDVSIEDSACKTAKISCDLGTLNTENFSCGGKLQADVSAGNIYLEGDFTGETYVDCELGQIEIDLNRPEAEYSYMLDTELGEVSVDGRDMGDHVDVTGGENYLEVSGSLGNIEIDFE